MELCATLNEGRSSPLCFGVTFTGGRPECSDPTWCYLKDKDVSQSTPEIQPTTGCGGVDGALLLQ